MESVIKTLSETGVLGAVLAVSVAGNVFLLRLLLGSYEKRLADIKENKETILKLLDSIKETMNTMLALLQSVVSNKQT